MKASAKAYTARFERGEKYWVVNIVEIEGCHTQARTIAQGKERIREALSQSIGDLLARRASTVFYTVLRLPGMSLT